MGIMLFMRDIAPLLKSCIWSSQIKEWKDIPHKEKLNKANKWQWKLHHQQQQYNRKIPKERKLLSSGKTNNAKNYRKKNKTHV